MGPTRFLISEAIVKNACSTFVDVLADVSRKGIPVYNFFVVQYDKEGDS